ncbi:exported protein [Betaproteobacteria bacterium]|nr:exported protein [Betaproteobacteria bacterium]
MIKRMISGLLAASSLICFPSVSLAAFPDKPITIVVPFGPGAGSDAVTRFLSERSSKVLGVDIYIDYKDGASGAIAAGDVKRSPRDGYRLILNSNSGAAANVYLFKSLNYDPVADFTPITGLTRNPLVLAIKPDIPAKNLEEFIKYAKENTGKLNYGVGNSSSMANAALFMSKAGFEATQVGYKALPAALIDLLGGRLDFLFCDPFAVKDHVKAGKLRALGVTSTARLKSMPDVPPIADVILGYELVGWIAAFAPAGTPSEIISVLNKAFVETLKQKESDDYLEGLGMQVFPTTPEEMGIFQKDQIKLWSEVLEKAGVPRN